MTKWSGYTGRVSAEEMNPPAEERRATLSFTEDEMWVLGRALYELRQNISADSGEYWGQVSVTAGFLEDRIYNLSEKLKRNDV